MKIQNLLMKTEVKNTSVEKTPYLWNAGTGRIEYSAYFNLSHSDVFPWIFFVVLSKYY